MLKVTVLGCGASGGVPLLGCDCAVCKSTNPKNRRSRVSILVQSATTTILVDTSPDLREQCLREGVKKIDAIIYTHSHADHLHGIDDVRSFNYSKDAPINTYSDAATLESIAKRFDYVFLPAKPAGLAWYRPALVPCAIEPYKPFTIGDIEVLPIEQQHGNSTTLGLRFGNFAYSTDTNGLSDKAKAALQGLDVWIVDCLRYNIAPTHAHLAMTLGWIAELRPKNAYLTHLNHEFDYDGLIKELPQGVKPAYDGLKLEIKAAKEHWENVYLTKKTNSVSWFQEHADCSIRLIQNTGAKSNASIIDVGGGASTLVDGLIANGYKNITVLDISDAALSAAKDRLKSKAKAIHWIDGDITKIPLVENSFDVWHDRAVFHFLTSKQDRVAYVKTLSHALKLGGHVIVATFAEDGPTQCSGLPIVRYSAHNLHLELGKAFELLHTELEEHHTPSGSTQKFIYCHFRKTI